MNKKMEKIWWKRTFTPQKSQPTPMWTFESGSDHQSVFSPLLPLSNEPERKPTQVTRRTWKKIEK